MRFGVEVLIGVLVGAIPFFVLRAPLNRILTDLCGTEDRAAFWARYTGLVLYLAPVLFALVSGSRTPATSGVDAAFLETTILAALFGTLCAVLAVGLMLVRIIRGQSNAPKDPP
jgi:hypothetical protein